MKLVDQALGIVRVSVADEDIAGKAREVRHRDLLWNDLNYTKSALTLKGRAPFETLLIPSENDQCQSSIRTQWEIGRVSRPAGLHHRVYPKNLVAFGF